MALKSTNTDLITDVYRYSRNYRQVLLIYFIDLIAILSNFTSIWMCYQSIDSAHRSSRCVIARINKFISAIEGLNSYTYYTAYYHASV